MFLAFRQSGAKDWNSNLAIALDHTGATHKLQFHHIFPKALLMKLGRTAREADDIANLAFIGGKTNRKISDTSPSTYIKKLREQIGPEVFMAQCIPLEEALLEPDNYDEFLVRRRDLIADRLNMFLGTDGAGAPRLQLIPTSEIWINGLRMWSCASGSWWRRSSRETSRRFQAISRRRSNHELPIPLARIRLPSSSIQPLRDAFSTATFATYRI